MPGIREALTRLRATLRTRALEEDLDAELAAHVEMSVDEHVRRGLPPEEARRRALIQLGGLTPTKALHRESRGLPWLETFVQDVRYSFRSLRRDAGLATFAVLIVGLGVGASTTVFSVVNALLLRALPFPEAERLVWIRNGDGDYKSARTVQVAYVQQLQAQGTRLADVAGFSPFYDVGDHQLSGPGNPERLTGVPVTQNFFPLLGVQPHVGRLFTVEETQSEGRPHGLMGARAPRTIVLSHGFWARRFASDPAVVGRALVIDNGPATVVGVLPPAFEFSTIFAPGTRVDFFSPFPLTADTNRRGNTLALVGRLSPNATPEAAQAEAAILAARIARTEAINRFVPRVGLLREHVSGQARPSMVVLACAVGLVMLIVCANLSNLLLARTAGRSREIALRAALGAGRGRLVRQLLTESILLSCGGAALGLLLAVWGTRVLSRLDTTIPLLEQVRVDGTVLGFTLLVAVMTGVAFGLAPALRTSALELNHALKEGGRGASDGKGQGRIRHALVVAEVTLACVLLCGAGLLLRSFLRVLEVDPGFQPRHAVAVRIDPSGRFPATTLQDAHYDGVLRQVRASPGVEAAALTDVLPFGFNRAWTVSAKGQTYAPGEQPDAYVRIVSEGYLRAMGIALRAGRDFSSRDDRSARPVILINEAMARTLWPGQDPLGRIVWIGNEVEREVIGVAAGTRHQALERESGAEMYIPMRQSQPFEYSQVHVVVRGARPPADLLSDVRLVLRSMDGATATNEVRILQDVVDKSVSPRRFLVLLVAGFAAFALVLASLGIYGVISFVLNQRRREIGIRIALGASPGSLTWSVIGEMLTLASAGAALGLLISWPLGRVLRGMLFEITPTDPVTFAAIPVLLLAVAALAGYLPARRALRLNPVEALRAE